MARSSVVFVCLLFALAMPAPSAHAAPASLPITCQNGQGFYPDDCPRFGQPGSLLANNSHHKVDFHDTLTSTGEASQWILNNRFPSLGFTWQWVDGSDYDVRIADGNYGEMVGWYGKVTCPSGSPRGGTSPRIWCSHRLLRLNLDVSEDFSTTWGKRVLFCHELGHTVGLNHPESGYIPGTCLEDERTPNNGESTSYDSSDVSAVTGWY